MNKSLRYVVYYENKVGNTAYKTKRTWHAATDFAKSLEPIPPREYPRPVSIERVVTLTLWEMGDEL